MPWLPRQVFHDWPQMSRDLTTDEVRHLYEQGFAGCKHSPEAWERFNDDMLFPDGDAAAHQFGLADTGAGKLVIPFVHVLEMFPGCWPGRQGQARGDCYAAGTMVLGETIKPIEDVEIGDRIWTAQGNLSSVISTRRLESSKPLVKVKPLGGLPLSCTMDHRMLVVERAAVFCGRKRKADAAETEPVWKTAGELQVGDYLLCPTSFAIPPWPVESPNDILNRKDGRFALGYFLGNGHASGHSVEWWTRSSAIADRLEATLRTAGWHVQPRTLLRETFRIRVFSVELVCWLRSQFYRGNAKNFPGWAIADSEFVAGLTCADGFHGDGYFDSTSLSLIYGVYVLKVMQGYEPSIGELKRTGTYPNAKPCYRLICREAKRQQKVLRGDNHILHPVCKIEILEGSQIVYDVGVADRHHSFIANGFATHNCVSWSTRNAALLTMVCDIVSGMPDEKTGKPEQKPDVSAEGVADGVLSTEAFYWYRGYDGDGWFCPGAAQVATTKGGLVVRQKYPFADLTSYSGRNAGLWGRRSPPAEVQDVTDDHLIHQATEARSFEAVRDLLYNGYGISSCGGEALEERRDENGVSRRKGSWAHAMAIIGADDRDVIKQLYREPLVLDLNSWAKWNSGPRDIYQSASLVPAYKKDLWIQAGIINSSTGNIMIPEGSCWVRWSEWSRREYIGFSGVNGWPAKPRVIDWIV
jgi:hypothetical protein